VKLPLQRHYFTGVSNNFLRLFPVRSAWRQLVPCSVAGSFSGGFSWGGHHNPWMHCDGKGKTFYSSYVSCFWASFSLALCFSLFFLRRRLRSISLRRSIFLCLGIYGQASKLLFSMTFGHSISLKPKISFPKRLNCEMPSLINGSLSLSQS